jgi:hypothetical protein
VDAVRDAVQFEGRAHEDPALAARASA